MYFSKTETDSIIRTAREKPGMVPDEIVSELIRKRKTVKERPAIQKILKTTCLVHEANIDFIKSKCRKAVYVRVRQQYFLIASLFKYSLTEIGAELYRDHATVLFGKKKALDFCKTESRYWHQIDNIMNEFPEHKPTLINRLSNLGINGK